MKQTTELETIEDLKKIYDKASLDFDCLLEWEDEDGTEHREDVWDFFTRRMKPTEEYLNEERRALLQTVNKTLKEDGITDANGDEITFTYWQDREIKL